MASVARATGTKKRVKKKIEENVVDHSRTVSDRRQFNAHVPINRLPIELLVEIFHYCRNSETFLSPFANLTKVCHHWYDLVVNTPGLWAIIDLCNSACYSESLFRLWLRRTKDIPLHLEAKGELDQDQTTSFNEDIVPDIWHRISSIDVHLHSRRPNPRNARTSVTLFTGIPQVPTTFQLRSIHLASLHTTYKFPDTFKHFKFPVIQTVKLKNAVGNIPLSLLGPTVVELELGSTGIQSIDPIKLIQCLSHMSSLRVLDIWYMPFRPSLNSTLSPQTISLPRLEQLSLQPPQRDEESYIFLLSKLHLSGLSQLYLDFRNFVPSHAQFPRLIDTIVALSRNVTFKSLQILDYSRITVTLWETTIDQDTLDMDDVSNQSFNIHFYYLCPDVLLEEFMYKIDLRHVEVVHCDLYGGIWRHIIATSRALKYLSASSASSAREMLKVLLERGEIGAYQGTPTPRFILPALEVIHLADMSWGNWDKMEKGCPLRDDMVAVLKERMIAGYPLQKVIILRSMEMRNEYIDSIRETGVEVEWDGIKN